MSFVILAPIKVGKKRVIFLELISQTSDIERKSYRVVAWGEVDRTFRVSYSH